MTGTVADILSARRRDARQPRANLGRTVDLLGEIDRLLDELTAAARSEGHRDSWRDWELIFNAIFSDDPDDIRLRTQAALDIVGERFPEYCEPDAGYEDDVRAWIEAFKEMLAGLEKRLRQDD